MMRQSRALQLRLLTLLLGNGVLLLAIRLLLREGSSAGEVFANAVADATPGLLAALGLTGIVWTGSLDLSLGSMVALGGTVFAILAAKGAPPLACFAACVLTCTALSLLNGAASRALRLPTILWTLGARTIYRGLALVLAPLCVAGFSGNFVVPAAVYQSPGKVHAPWILLGGALLLLVWEANGKTPRLWLALGCSEQACRLQGLSPGRIQMSAFLVGGVYLGLAALVQVTQAQAIEPARFAIGLELPVLGAVVLGGSNIFGGEGSYLGTILGASFLYFLGQLLAYAGVNVYWREVAVGAAIVAVIGLDCLLQKRRRRLEELE